MKKVISLVLGVLIIVAPLYSQEDTQPSPANENSSVNEISPAVAPRNQVDVVGDAVIRSEGEITVVPSVIDQELHNQALILNSIGQPLYDVGEVLVGISVATWVLWGFSFLGSIGTVAVAGLFSDSTTLGVVSGALAVTSTSLLGVSIGLSAGGVAALITGGVLTVVGDARREQSFAELR